MRYMIATSLLFGCHTRCNPTLRLNGGFLNEPVTQGMSLPEHRITSMEGSIGDLQSNWTSIKMELKNIESQLEQTSKNVSLIELEIEYDRQGAEIKLIKDEIQTNIAEIQNLQSKIERIEKVLHLGSNVVNIGTAKGLIKLGMWSQRVISTFTNCIGINRRS
jgi:predicted RNase H-like nuclease (RuvC/YqgF family)